MANIFDWLENTHQPSYASGTSSLAAPSGSTLRPMDDDHFMETLTDDITLLDVNEDDSSYFSYSQMLAETTPPDPPLITMGDPAIGQTVVTVPEHLAKTSSKILIFLAQILEVPDDPAEQDNGTAFTAEELEALQPIDEETLETVIPDFIDGINVNLNPQPTEIKDVIDRRRIGPQRQTYYLAKSINGIYYWFRSSRVDNDRRVRNLITGYRSKVRAEASNRQTRGMKELRSGKVVRM
jgi:hypothetical protein